MPTQMPINVVLEEVFSSVQGEGPWVGERQIFVRLHGCHLSCAFCDTPESSTPEFCRIERTPGMRDFEEAPNPCSVEELTQLLLVFDQPRGLHHSVAITGGEPLLRVAFLEELFPRLKQEGFNIYLETAGDLYRGLSKVIHWVDYISMDIKIPSVTRDKPLWDQHATFLSIACQKQAFAKAVVCFETTDEEIQLAAAIIAKAAPSTLLILQPVTPCGQITQSATPSQLLNWQKLSRQQIPNVRIIPQCHKLMGQL